MSVPTSVPFAQLLCRLYAAGSVKPGTTFTYLAPASHRARANAAGPDDGPCEPFGSAAQHTTAPLDSRSDVVPASTAPPSSPAGLQRRGRVVA